jgi:myo-inositol-1(or 4)-monophosphatase
MSEPTINDLEELARGAGEILRAGFGRRPGFDHNLRVENKSLTDLVTDIDRQSDEFLWGEIRRRFPKHGIISEERASLNGDGEYQWIIDPLDGTVNYAHGFPTFCVSIACVRKGDIRSGVVYDPILDECFIASVAGGAFLNGQAIRVSSARDLDHSMLATGFPYDIRSRPDNNLDHFTRLSLISQGMRSLGAAALDLCYVAAGRIDGFWEIRLNAWDVAAGSLIAREAGAVVTNVQGTNDLLTNPTSVLAANPQIHPLLLKELSRS